MIKKKPILPWIIKLFLSWRIFLLIVATYAIQALPFKSSFPYWESLLAVNGHPLFWSWGNFDGVHYITIAKQGYSAQFTQAFFPLFPLLIRYTSQVINNYLASGLLISHLSALVALLLFYKLVSIDRGDSTARRTILYFILFPTSFYLVSLYTESFFLCLVFAAFLSARRSKWWLAGIFGALASATRVLGILLLPALLVDWYYSKKTKSVYTPSELVKALFPIFFSSAGLLVYMNYLKQAFSDPLLFINAQPAFGASRTSDKLILLYQVFWRYAKMIFSVDPSSLLYFTVWQEALSGFLFLILSFLAFKYTRTSYALFGLLSYVVPTLTGTFSSMPRYVLILFPSFMVLGLIKNPRFQRIWWLISAILLAINTALFVRGYWIA